MQGLNKDQLKDWLLNHEEVGVEFEEDIKKLAGMYNIM